MKKLVPLFALLLAALALAACGGGDDNGDTSPVGGAIEEAEDKAGEAKDEVEDKAGEAKDEAEEAGGEGGASGTLAVEADPDGALAFTEDSLTIKAGKATIDFNNPAPVPHDVRVADKGGKDIGGTEVITGKSEKAPIELKAGEYTFYCSVPGHREAGMEGDLTVE
jgi:uncharacterized cupredoxin-like copper-binding protein